MAGHGLAASILLLGHRTALPVSSFPSALLAGSCKGYSDDLGENANTDYFLLSDVLYSTEA